ncbi:hypothetical protein DUI87_05807 [Hirundo rustica rustica]|uniref:ATP-dependent RNA helicase n=1 Tax=Hirundo rustica rustica TaxID=333673 RepID=A0A3M0KVB1_HIRRU|nr:hypothetical protein DUI87_05807 [Hirundo rustica rustica]
MAAFSEMGVMPEIAQAVEEMDWLLPTDIQAESIPLILGGGDVLMAAETGSGKTGAFSIPVIQIVYETLKDQMEGKKGKATIKTGGAGKYYYEVSCHDQGLCRVGWSTMQASLDLGEFPSEEPTGSFYVDVEWVESCSSVAENGFLGTDKFGFGFGGTGKKSHNKQFDSYGEEFTMHDTIGCYLDTEKGQIKFSKNGNAQVVQAQNLPNAPKALIVEPSRELAEQTLNNVKQFKKYVDNPKLRELLIIGGVAARDQLSVLEQGVDIVVGTPGRLDDLVSTGKINLSQVRFLVLDEAVIVCSATLHSFDVKKLSEKIMHFPTWVDLKGEDSVPETVHHVVVPVNPKADKLWERLGKNHIRTDEVHAKDNTRPGANTPEMWSEAIKILKGEYTVRAIKEHKMDQAIIFCRTKIDCDNMEQYFIQQGGEQHFITTLFLQRGDVRFLICTDVAARGIDIHGVPYVINVTLPDEKQNYVHRIGRVGRAERMGLAISLVAKEKEKVWYHVCSSRGKGCYNTRLKEEGGCTIWYNEMQLLGEIEEHLNCTIAQVEPDIKVPVDDFDGKVTYGQKRALGGGLYKGHVDILAPTVQELAALEKEAQTSFLHLGYLPNQLFRTF